MPDVNARASRNIELQKVDKTVSPAEGAKIGGISSMPSIGSTKETVEDTTIPDKIRHRIVSMEDPPSFTLTVFYDPNETPQGDLMTAYDNETEDDYWIVFNDISPEEKWEFKAIITNYTTPYGGIGELLQQDFTFQLNENDYGEVLTRNPS